MILNPQRFHFKTFLGKCLRLPLKLIPKSFVMPILQGPARGMKWLAGSSTHGCWLGTYEAEKVRVVEKWVKPDMTVYDIGAQVGYYSCIFSKLAHQGRIFSFEPLPENITYLLRHIQMNKLENVQAVHVALAEESRMSGFSVEAEKHKNNLISSENAQLLTPTISIDDAVEIHHFPLPDLLKIDAEGAEHQILQGARRTIVKSHPAIFLSLHGENQKAKCFQFLRETNYAI